VVGWSIGRGLGVGIVRAEGGLDVMGFMYSEGWDVDAKCVRRGV